MPYKDRLHKFTKLKKKSTAHKVTLVQYRPCFVYAILFIYYHVDQKQQQLYILAALIKSLADVPEQIWHALEGHQYLQAGCLYTLAQKVHGYLETEESFMVDIDVRE